MFWGVLWLSKMCVVPELWLLTCKPVPCERRTSFIRIWDFRNFYSLLKALPPLLMKWKWKVQVLVTQLCPTLCDPMVCGPPGYSVHGIHARILEWVAMPFSRGSSWTRDRAWVPCIAGRFFIIWAIKEYHLVKRGQVWDWGSEQLVTSEKMKILVKQIKSLGISWAGLPSELAMYVTLKGMTWALWLRQKKKRPSRTWVSAPGGNRNMLHPRKQQRPVYTAYLYLEQQQWKDKNFPSDWGVRREYVPSTHLCVPDQLCLTLCNPMECSPPGSSVHGDSPGKNTGVGVAISFSRASSQPRDPTWVNKCLLTWQAGSLLLCHLRSPHPALLGFKLPLFLSGMPICSVGVPCLPVLKIQVLLGPVSVYILQRGPPTPCIPLQLLGVVGKEWGKFHLYLCVNH